MSKSSKRRRRARSRAQVPSTTIEFDLRFEEVMADLTYGWSRGAAPPIGHEKAAGERAA